MRNLAIKSEQRCKQLELACKTLEKQLADAELNAKKAVEESELYLDYLHQVQEEMERHHMDGTANRAELSRLREEVDRFSTRQKQLMQERETARNAANAAEAARKKQADEYAQVQKKLTDELSTVRKNFAHSESERKKLESKILELKKQRGLDITQLEESMAIQDRLLQERDVAREIASNAKKRSDGLEIQKSKTQKKLDDAYATIKALQQESESLLAQLHQVQEEIESYHLANRQILTVMEHAEATMDCARAVLIDLAKR